MTDPIRAGLIGAGYIAGWHADAIRTTPGAQLTAICDSSASAAQGLAEATGARGFSDAGEMLASGLCDIVHILTPPDSHRDLALQVLQAGHHVLVEKPVATSAAETAEIEAAAQAAGRVFAAGHNFLGMPGYLRLREAMRAGTLGRIDTAEIRWCFPFAPLRSGPYGLWPLRTPENLLLELGPHLFAFAVDLFGPVEVLQIDLSRPVELPGMGPRPQGWRILARAGGVDVTFQISLVETWDDRSVSLRGSSGMARFDYATDALVVRRDNAADLVLNPLIRELSPAWSHLREGAVNAARQLSSLNAKSPYGLSFRGTLAAVYGAIRAGQPLDARFAGATAVTVMEGLDAALARVPPAWQPKAPKVASRGPRPDVLVIGGTGFIGRHLTRELVARGHDVRVASRGRSGPFADLPDHVETVPVSLRDGESLRAAMRGIDTVVNLAKSLDKTWEAALENDVRVTERIAEAALAAGVRRLVYTGTIASYDMSDPKVTITEATGFAADMSDRNLYARSKAECEGRLLALHRERGLPVTIARPGIVIGPGGPLQHWGIGRWHGSGAVRVWGNGRNTLPFVLIDDVTEGLIRMMQEDAALGDSFNLVGERMMSARDYFDAIQERLGARIRVVPGNLTAFWAADAVKHQLKSRVLKRTGLTRPSLRDWKSRAHLSPFDNAHPKAVLGWQPEADRARFVERGIVQAGLFGI
ncbi:MAG: NAD-dependent epimerase/dehydratase family protein [Paracoccaceae bacterium]